MDKILIYIAIFLIPVVSLFQMPGTIVWYPQVLAVIGLGALIACMHIWEINKPLACIALYSAFSYFFVCNQHPRAMLLLIICFAGIALICMASKIENTSKVYQCIIWMSIIQFGLVMLQKFNLDPLFHSNTRLNLSETVGFIGSHNQLGIYYAAVAPILFHFCMPLVIISMVAILFSASSSAAIGALVGILTYLLAMRSFILLFIFIPVVLVAFFIMHKYDNLEHIVGKRVELWKQTMEQAVSGKAKMNMGQGVTHIISKNPMTGFGLGNFMSISPATQGERIFGKGWDDKNTPRWEHAHNDLVEYFFDFGWLGLPFLLWLLADILDKFIFTVKTNRMVMVFSALVAQVVTSMGVYVIHAPVSYFMLCLTLGLFYAEVNDAKKGEISVG